MLTVIVNFLPTLLLLLFLLFINVSKSYGEMNYDSNRYDMHQRLNIPFSTKPNIKMRPGFRLKTRISDHQRAKLSWLAGDTEAKYRNPVEPPRARPLFHLASTKQQTQGVISPTNRINYQQHYQQQQPQMISTNYINYQYPYYQQLPINYHTLPPIYYASNFRTIPPPYYNNYQLPTFVQPTRLPLSAMMSAIRSILSIVQETIHPNSTRNIDSHKIHSNNISEEANLINGSKQLPSSLSSSLLSSLSSSSSSSSSSSFSTVAEEIGVTSISGIDNDNEKKELMNVERMKGTSIGKIKEMSKLIEELTSNEIGEIINSTENIITTIATTTTITTTTVTTTTITATKTTTFTTTIPSTTTTSSIDDGSNLLGSLLSGRLDKIDWFGSLFGMNNLPSKEEGSAMAQIFEGGIFGPAS